MRSRRGNKKIGNKKIGQRGAGKRHSAARARRKKRVRAQDIERSFEEHSHIDHHVNRRDEHPAQPMKALEPDEATVISLGHDSESVFDAITPVVDVEPFATMRGAESPSDSSPTASSHDLRERTESFVDHRRKSYVSAGLFRRLLAGFIDAIAISPILYIVTWIIGLFDTQLLARGGFTSLFDWAIEGSPMLILWFLLAILVVIGYQFAFLYILGVTPGSRLLKMRVISEDGGPLKKRVVLIRTCSLCIGLLAFGLGVAWIGVHPFRQGLHDIFCRTFVIRDDVAA